MSAPPGAANLGPSAGFLHCWAPLKTSCAEHSDTRIVRPAKVVVVVVVVIVAVAVVVFVVLIVLSVGFDVCF